jgi:hypothetical protein
MGSGGPGGSAAGHERAWRYLLEEQQFDVALLQETRAAPEWASDRLRSVTWSPKYATAGPNRPLWGCAVVSTSLDLFAYEPPAEFRWLRERSGSVAIAQTTGDPRWFASVHFYVGEIPDQQVRRHTVEGIRMSTPNGTTDVLLECPRFRGHLIAWVCPTRRKGCGVHATHASSVPGAVPS